MTFSIVAWDAATAMTGVAVSTKHLAVGALVPFAQTGVGAIATQGLTNPLLGVRGLKLLETYDAATTLEILLRDDEGREHRQLHLVDRQGNAAGWTGRDCLDWSGHQSFPGFSVAGNILVGEATIQAMAKTYQTTIASGETRAEPPVSFAERLLLALEAGQAAGGDRRGRQSAALYVVSTELYPDLDLRVDDHPDPVAELRRLFGESQQDYYTSFRQSLPTRSQPAGSFSRDLVETLVANQLTSS
jgi:uncharacterized Ntn-hydrolase superfamily protein